jgi:hypothetical protein
LVSGVVRRLMDEVAERSIIAAGAFGLEGDGGGVERKEMVWRALGYNP